MRYMTKTNPVTTIDELFDSMFYGTEARENQYSSFPVDITEDGDGYTLSAELPGFNDSDVEITINDNILVVSAEKMKKAGKKDEEKEVEERRYLLRERVERRFRRSFTLPDDAERDSVKASLKDGLLVLSIGKKPEAKPLSIKING